ncbi:MAG: hypothetical protein IJW99_01320 [Clostridia bacterium]|nr:hypothetical protein [Clostridia bacterium]
MLPSFNPPDILPLPPHWTVRLSRSLFVFSSGGALYFFIEILWRGYSHFSMFLCGGLCFSGIYLIHRICCAVPRPLRWLYGAVLITVVEFWCGVIVNLLLGWNVWNYTALPLNLLGQVCLPFTLIWFLLCIPADMICGLFCRLFRIELPQKY